MRVLLTSHYWWPHAGGIERVALGEATGLVAQGHEVRVLTSDVAGQQEAAPAQLDPVAPVDATRVKAWNGLERIGVPWPVFAPRLIAEARVLVEWADVVLAHGLVYLPTLAGVWQASRLGVPVVVFHHNPHIHFEHAALNVAQRIVFASLGRWAAAHADRILVPSSAAHDYVRSVTNREVQVLPPGLDLQRLQPQSSVEELKSEREELGLPADSFVILGVGRLARKNQFPMLLRAVAALGETIPHRRCIIVGGGPELHRLRMLNTDLGGDEHTQVVGYVDDATLRLLLRSADVVVATAGANEGFGLVMAEALACGVPVVASSEGGHTDLVSDGVNGWLFDGTVGGLTHALARAHESRAGETRQAWVVRARRSVERVGLDQHLSELQLVLSEVRHRGAKATMPKPRARRA